MSQINPFTGSILQTPQVQRQQAVEKDRQARRVTDRVKNSALTEDQLDHQVESSEAVIPIHEEERHDRQFKRPRHHKHPADPQDDANLPPHLDLTA